MKRETKLILTGLIGAGALALLVLSILSSSQYMTVSELYKYGRKNTEVVVVGKVLDNSIRYIEGKVQFTIFDENSTKRESVNVVYVGEKNINVYEGAITVVKGHFNGTAIIAREVLTKCPSAYTPASVEDQK